jgi:hypothetical protein
MRSSGMFSGVYDRLLSLPIAGAAGALPSPQSSERWHPSNNSSLHAPNQRRDRFPKQNMPGYVIYRLTLHG